MNTASEAGGAQATNKPRWRTGRKVKRNVYDGDAPVCQCQTDEYAALIVDALNRTGANTEQLAAAQEELRVERERLDWLEQVKAFETWPNRNNLQSVGWSQDGVHVSEAKTVRAAIDAARSQKGEPK